VEVFHNNKMHSKLVKTTFMEICMQICICKEVSKYYIRYSTINTWTIQLGCNDASLWLLIKCRNNMHDRIGQGVHKLQE